MKQFVGILTTTGYATVAGGGWEPRLAHKAIQRTDALLFSFGVACLGPSVYMSPEGEQPDGRS